MARQLKFPNIYTLKLKDSYTNNTIKEIYSSCDLVKVKKEMDNYKLCINRYYLTICLRHFNEMKD